MEYEPPLRSRRLRRGLLRDVLTPHLLVPVLRASNRGFRIRETGAQGFAVGLDREAGEVRFHRLAALPQTGQRRALASVPFPPLRRHLHAPVRVRERLLVLPAPAVRRRPVAEQDVVGLIEPNRHRELLRGLGVIPGRERGVALLLRLDRHLRELRVVRLSVVAATAAAVVGVASGRLPRRRGRGRDNLRRRRLRRRLRLRLRLRLRRLQQARHRQPLPVLRLRDYARGQRPQVLLHRVHDLGLLREGPILFNPGELQRRAHQLHRRLAREVFRAKPEQGADARVQIDRRGDRVAAALAPRERDVSRGLLEAVLRRRVRAAVDEQRLYHLETAGARGGVQRRAVRVVPDVGV
ncbi:uncharacterized protein MICPUCDRAFT_66346 [Micromonas pusilla CCMP1545]|uniref:Predicted protein n=1 Tax=Micromonas pusilla (strain CCMP1545) TaxID=564608 RepID=C1N8B7_MICPC|nr:uncharacterized protein MICPUCDRAFT_66346 [Micromonas pusilla CCMP1545]EEH51676.1 predicted protein [Micromonas pusilla CCMP1545]|eukprot:XP_003064054.1 predicted protein [Micromonas pusilla CCMP1545]